MKNLLVGLSILLVFSGVASTTQASHLCPIEPGCLTDKLNVPGDFVGGGSFAMDLLGGLAVADSPSTSAPIAFANLSAQERQILFGATEFDGIAPGSGTSTLTLTSINHWEFGSDDDVAGFPVTFYIDGAGTGTLVDNGDGTGEWTLEVPVLANWNDIDFPFLDVVFSTNASYDYWTWDQESGAIFEETVTGIAMDYHTGDAFLVGQSSPIDDPTHPFNGMRATFALFGNDPLVANSVPLPAAVWLFGSGLLGLIGIAKKRKAT